MTVVDTYDYKHHAIKISWQLICAFWNCKDIFVLLSRNGRTFLFPVIFCLNKLFHRQLYHDVVGGALPEEAASRPALLRQLRLFNVNWVELPKMKLQLEELGLQNVQVLPNFKKLNILSEEELTVSPSDPKVFVMFSRVTKSKGMTLAAETIASINEEAGAIRAKLDIWGPVEDEYQQEFDDLLRRYQDIVHYRGTVPYEQSVRTLKGYYMLLFPSTYFGEGMPGTLIDAFSAGLPVIASDWHFNADVVCEGKTGFCYRWDFPAALKERILFALDHPEIVDPMRTDCIREAAKYTPEYAMNIIIETMNNV